jgi:hypothetical protein
MKDMGKKENSVDATLSLHDFTTGGRSCHYIICKYSNGYLKNQPVGEKKIRIISFAAKISTMHQQYCATKPAYCREWQGGTHTHTHARTHTHTRTHMNVHQILL